MSTQQEQSKPAGLAAWRKRHRFAIQSGVLAASLALPFALYAALQAGRPALAAVLFGVLALAMAVAAWAG